MRPIPLAAALACCAAAVLPAAAAADTLVYTKAGDVYVANADGSSPRQLTHGGGYVSPAAADDGTIVAAEGDDVVRLSQAGVELGRFTAPVLTDSAGGTAGSPPFALDVSPDGTKVAFTRASLTCDPTIECGARATTGVTDMAGTLLPGGRLFGKDPSFVGNGRVLYHGGFGSQNMVWDVGSAEPFHWFDDGDLWADDTDLGGGDVSADGRRLVQERGYGDQTSIMWYSIEAGIAPGTPPHALCEAGPEPGVGSPTTSGDGTRLWWQEPTGVWIKPNAASCTSPQPSLLIPGAAEPDWGPAPLAPDAPAPAPTPPGPATPGPGKATPQPGRPATAKARLSKVRRGKRAVRFTLTCTARCAYSVKLVAGKRTLARKAGKAKRVTLALRHKGVRRGLKLRVIVGGRTLVKRVPR